MEFKTKIKCLNPKQQYYQQDEVIIGFESLDFFKLMNNEDCEGNSVVYKYKELNYHGKNSNSFLVELSRDLTENFDKWNVSKSLTSFMNIEIGTNAKDLCMRELSYLLNLQKVLFDEKLVWNVNYSSHDFYKIQLIVPVLKK